jgi:hypothetical protein
MPGWGGSSFGRMATITIATPSATGSRTLAM